MEKNGLLIDVSSGVAYLAKGRRLLYANGTEAEGLKMYQDGCKMLISLFDEALGSGDAELMFLSEFYYTSCELSASQGSEPVAVKSAQSAVRKFEEGLAALEIVVNPQRYEAVHSVLSTEPSFRYKGMPKDAFHVAVPVGHCPRKKRTLAHGTV